MDHPERLERILAATRRRLRLRTVLRTVAVAVHPALLLGVAVVGVGRLAAVPRPAAALAALVAATVVVAGAGAVGLAMRGLDRRALALLVDRLGGTDETVLTAVHVAEPGAADPNREAILARFDALDLTPRSLIPLRVPRHLGWVPVEAVALLLALAVVPPWLELPFGGGADPVVREGERLDERLAELAAGLPPEGAPLPEEIERELADLTDDLRGGELSAEEARERMAELQQQLAAFDERLAPSADLLQDLERAAEDLRTRSTEALSEALREGDLGAAAEAARDLSSSLAEASPEERARAAEALQRAGEALKRSADPSLQRAGEAMASGGQRMRDATGGAETPAGDGGDEGEPGQPGDDPPSGAGASSGGGVPSPEQAAELARELERARAVGEQLARDRAALERSQAVNGALEGSRQRLGGDPRVAEGRSSSSTSGEAGGTAPGPGGGEGAEGEPSGSGPGGAGPASDGVGTEGHTWEDRGEFVGRPEPGAEDRFSDRRSGTHIDDFEKLYSELRLAGAQSLLAGVEGQVDERGQVDQLPIRITTGDEEATVPRVEIPASWRDQAVEAIESEPIPPAYEQAVKRYFGAD